MRRTTAIILACMLVLAFPCGTLAAGKAAVTQEAFYVRPFTTYFAGEIYAEVTNTGDKPVVFNGGLVELYNPSSDAIESKNLHSCYPSILAPGESGYFYSTIYVKEATEKSFIDDYALTVTGKAENANETVRLEAAGVYELFQRSKYSSSQTVIATVTNNTPEMLRGLRVVFVLFDGEDKLPYANSTELYSLGVPAGQTLEVRDTVDSRLVGAWEEDGVVPTRVDIIAYVEREL